MLLNFTTLFNVNYLAKGLALHQSLLKNCPHFHLFIIAFDDITYQVLTEKKLISATIISTGEFEDEQLLQLKKERSIAEYCWTCEPLSIKYCINNYGLSNCTYLDADTYFYSDPSVLIDEMGENSILITPHNYHSAYDQSRVSGIYCVQFTTFKNTAEGIKVLNWWASACLKWCFDRYEDGKMGDQKYLDSWPYIFESVHICRNPGAGLAPWNVKNYNIVQKDGSLYANGSRLIFYHFHDLKYLSDNSWFIGGYEIPENAIDNIYKPYIQTLKAIHEELNRTHNNINSLNTIDKKKITALSLKFKTGLYIMNLKKSFKLLISDLLFIKQRNHYKNNYIRL